LRFSLGRVYVLSSNAFVAAVDFFSTLWSPALNFLPRWPWIFFFLCRASFHPPASQLFPFWRGTPFSHSLEKGVFLNPLSLPTRSCQACFPSSPVFFLVGSFWNSGGLLAIIATKTLFSLFFFQRVAHPLFRFCNWTSFFFPFYCLPSVNVRNSSAYWKFPFLLSLGIFGVEPAPPPRGDWNFFFVPFFLDERFPPSSMELRKISPPHVFPSLTLLESGAASAH